MQAQDVMTTKVTTIEAGATVREAARRMLERRVSALPVVDDRGRVTGVVSEGDLVRRAELGTDAARSWWLRMFTEDGARDYIRTHGAAVADVMSTPAIGVRRATPLQEVARLMEKHRVKRLPVLEAGRLVGIFSQATSCDASRPRRRRPRAAARFAAGRRKVEDHTVVLPPLVVASLGAV